jgi:hypothetical protein
MQNTAFHLGWALLLTHEIDAMAQHEWRLLYVLRDLPDTTAASWFIAMHVPLFWLLSWLFTHANSLVRERSRLGLAVFLIIHALMHKRLENDPLYTFNTPLSNGIIFGAALAGIVYCGLAWRARAH